MTTIIIEALSGLGMFLFGMYYMELSIKEAAGVRFKSWVRHSTSSVPKSLLTGTLATAVLQSSSVVTLMTLSFVSASMMTLNSGIGVIFGANVGTTVTAWIVATLGFKVQIEAFALPMIGAGGLLLMLAGNNKKILGSAKVAIGFGLLFLGLDIMKNAIEGVATAVDLSTFSAYPPIVFLLIGFALTALIQSSSAATAIVLSALYAQILSFDHAAAMVIGSNIGTTVTALLGAIGGIPDKKRVAMAHLLFNVITAIVAFMLLPFLTYVLMDVLALNNDQTTALALFHTIFNILGVLLLSPFIGFLALFLNNRFTHKAQVATRYIHLVDPHSPDTAIVALRNEVSNLFVKTMKFALLLANIKPGDLLVKKMEARALIEANQTLFEFDYHKAYSSLKEIEISIAGFVARLNEQNLTQEQSQQLESLLTSVRESVYAAKILKDSKENIDDFAQSDNPVITEIFQAIRRNLAYGLQIYVNYMNGDWDAKRCQERFAKALDENRRIMRETTLAISRSNITEKTVVSLLNTNQSILTANESLMEASEVLQLHFDIAAGEDERYM